MTALRVLAAGMGLGYLAGRQVGAHLFARNQRKCAAERPANLTPLSDSEVVSRIRAQMDENAALRELRAGLENWGKP